MSYFKLSRDPNGSPEEKFERRWGTGMSYFKLSRDPNGSQATRWRPKGQRANRLLSSQIKFNVSSMGLLVAGVGFEPTTFRL